MLQFENLEAWRLARKVVSAIYAMRREPGLAKDFGLCGQLQRAAVSIMSNRAEGFERIHIQEKLQFYNIARGSCGEVRSLLYVVEDNYPSLADQTGAKKAFEVSPQAEPVFIAVPLNRNEKENGLSLSPLRSRAKRARDITNGPKSPFFPNHKSSH